ncbi:MAG: MarR family transcriptional regulator [Alphaproteobacteria bacterium]|nr:MarR family transcriptional regulator [Alphaproteobacteria bacterium]
MAAPRERKHLKDVYPAPAPDGREVCACFRIREASRRISAFYEDALGPTGLTIAQFSLIGMAVALERQRGEPPTVTTLAAALDLDRTTLVRNLKPVAAARLVAIGPGRDRRARAVRATAAGRAAYRNGLSLWRRAQDGLRARLGAEPFGLLMRSLERSVTALQDQK